jgi:hypothetical protein
LAVILTALVTIPDKTADPIRTAELNVAGPVFPAREAVFA